MSDIGPQKKIRFKQNAHKKLRRLPSHAGAIGPVHAPILAPRHLIWKRSWIGVLAFIGFAFAALIVFARVGYLSPLVEKAASDALLASVPSDYRTELGKTKVSFSWSQGPGITYQDIKVYPKEGSAPLATLGKVTLGVAIKATLAGKAEFSSITVENVEVEVPPSPESALPRMRFDQAHDAFETVFSQLRSGLVPFLNQTDGLDISLQDLAVNLPDNGYSSAFLLKTLSLKAEGGSASFDGKMDVDGYAVSLNGTIEMPLPGANLEAESKLSIALTAMPMPWRRLQTLVSNDPDDHEIGKRHIPVLADVAINLSDYQDDERDIATATLKPVGMAFKLGTEDYVPVAGSFDMSMNFQTSILRIKPTSWSVGRSTFELNGAVRDRAFELSQGAQPNAFEFELLANRGTAAPADSPEEPIRFAARAQGTTFLNARQIEFGRLDISSDGGTAYGEGDISLQGEFPTAIFDVRVDDMSIAGIKQFWPAPVARGARRWSLENLAGGRIVKGQFDIAEPLRRRIPGTGEELTGDTRVQLAVEDVQFNVVGDIPPVRNADGSVEFADGLTTVSLNRGVVYLPGGQTASAKDGVLVIPRADKETGLIRAKLSLGVSGKARAIGELISFDPIGAQQFYAFEPEDLSGDVSGLVNVNFLLNGDNGADPDWDVDLQVAEAGSATKIEGRDLDGLDGRILVDPSRAEFELAGNIDGFPSNISMTVPFANSEVAARRDISLLLDTPKREQLAPGLDVILTGNTPVRVAGSGETLQIEADLTTAKLSLPWIGWAKGEGVEASAVFNLLQSDTLTSLNNFKLSGGSFGATGEIDADSLGLKRARFGFAKLNQGDDVSLDVTRNGDGYDVDVSGNAFDARAIMRYARAQARNTTPTDSDVPVNVTANIKRVTGFHGEYLDNVTVTMRVRDGTVTYLRINGSTKSGFPVSLAVDGAAASRNVSFEALGAGEALRFADIYTNVRGGTVNMTLKATDAQTLAGEGTLRDFRVFNEPKLAQLVSTRASDSQSLEEAVNKKIDTREVKFEIASSELVFRPGRLEVAKAIARGPLAGFSIQGLVFDSNNQTRLTGTFLPAYGLNRLFGEIPVLGALLGNGRDRGLIGVTFKLDGSYDDPNVTVNPLSVIAPGIFRSIFEFR